MRDTLLLLFLNAMAVVVAVTMVLLLMPTWV